MVAILGLGHIQVKGEIVKIRLEYVVKVDETSKIKKRTYTRSCAQY